MVISTLRGAGSITQKVSLWYAPYLIVEGDNGRLSYLQGYKHYHHRDIKPLFPFG